MTIWDDKINQTNEEDLILDAFYNNWSKQFAMPDMSREDTLPRRVEASARADRYIKGWDGTVNQRKKTKTYKKTSELQEKRDIINIENKKRLLIF